MQIRIRVTVCGSGVIEHIRMVKKSGLVYNILVYREFLGKSFPSLGFCLPRNKSKKHISKV